MRFTSSGRSFVPPPAFTTRPTLDGDFGMSASTHWLATATAQSVLERGGNAFDAAVAGAFVLHVVEPHLNGAGGDMTGIFCTAAAPDEPMVMMGQGPAPAGASPAHFGALGLDLVPGSGALAAAVPGAVDAWLKLLQEQGSWELREVLDYAVHYAEHGFPIAAQVHAAIASVEELFREHWPTSAAQWMPGGAVPAAGDVVANREYAQVLRELVGAGESGGATGTRESRIAAARQEWKTGRVARSICEFVAQPHRHADGADHAGVIAMSDFAAFEACFERPVIAQFRGYAIAKTGPWGQGPVLLQALKILEGFEDERLDPSTEIGAHTILEALKLAFADRDTYYGDTARGSDGTARDIDVLLSDEYAVERRALIGSAASAEFRPGRVPGWEPVVPPLVTADEFAARTGTHGGSGAGIGEPTVRANGELRGDTCHIDVVDRWGNMISATPSGGWLQSSPTIPGLGICLGTRLQMMWLDLESPSRLEPGRRPRTTLTPTLVLREGRPVMALGSPGGDQQDQWQLLFLLRTLVGGYTPQEAIDAPALHTTAMPGSFYPRTWAPAGAVVEDRLGDAVIAGLERRGHRVTRAGDWTLGRLSCVIRDPATGRLHAAANPRGAQGYAAGR